jgi:hypothetical protein
MSQHQVRVTAYLDRRQRAQGIDKEHIHGFDGGGDDPGFQLLQSDLRAILADLDAAVKERDAAAKALSKLYAAVDSCVGLTPEVMMLASLTLSQIKAAKGAKA